MATVEGNVSVLRQRERELRQKLSELRDQRRPVIEELKELRAKRFSLIEEIKSKRAELREIIENKRKLQGELAKLREERKEAFEKFRQAKDEALKIKQEYEDIVNSVGVPERVLRRRISRLERRIETSPLTKDQERDMVMQISQYEAMLQDLNRAKALKRKLIEMMAEAEKWRFFVRDSGERIGKVKDQLKGIYESITKKKEELDKRREEIDGISKEINERSKHVDEMREEMEKIREKVRSIQEEIRHRFEKIISSNKEVERKLKEKLAEEAFEKYKAREKLTIDELKVLMELGLLEKSTSS